jgi:hypothetical protein
MNRREALKRVSLLGSAVSLTTLVVSSHACRSKQAKTPSLSSKEQEEIVCEIADVLIPATDVPGAKAAGIGAFVVMMLRDCYPEDVQNDFIMGLNSVQKMAELRFDRSFVSLDQAQRQSIVSEIAADEVKRGNRPNFFKVMRELTFLGFFTSEVGATQALEHVSVPGVYDGCLPLHPNQKAFTS